MSRGQEGSGGVDAGEGVGTTARLWTGVGARASRWRGGASWEETSRQE